MPVEWVTVYPPTDSPPAVVNRKHYELVLKDKGFRLTPPKKEKKEKD